MSNGIQLDPFGSARPKSPGPKTILANAYARESFWRTIIAGVVLGALVIALIIAMLCRPEHVSAILAVLATGIGYLLGSRERKSPED